MPAILAFLSRFAKPLLILALIVLWSAGLSIIMYRAGKVNCQMSQLEAALETSQKVRKADEKIKHESPGSGASTDAILKYTRKHAVKREF
jgi:hypothetical protein